MTKSGLLESSNLVLTAPESLNILKLSSWLTLQIKKIISLKAKKINWAADKQLQLKNGNFMQFFWHTHHYWL